MVACVAIVGCAAPAVDNSPKVTGAIVNAEYAINGQILPDFTGKQVVHTTANKRSIRDTNKFDSFIMRWANSDEAVIARLDLNTSYDVNYKTKKYSECPLAGCTKTSFLDQFEDEKGAKSEDDFQDYEELGCKVEMTSNDFNVTKTGAKRQLNGFAVEQYTVMWSVEYQDTDGQKDLNEISFDFWTTNASANMSEVWQVHDQFQEGFAKSVKDAPLMRLLGENGYKAIAAFTGDINNQENKFGGEIGKKLATIKGYPISIKFEWVRNAQACKKQKTASAGGLDFSGGLEGVGKQLLGNFAKKGSDMLLNSWRKEPLVRYVYEVKSVSMTNFSQRIFEVPEGFDLIDRQ